MIFSKKSGIQKVNSPSDVISKCGNVETQCHTQQIEGPSECVCVHVCVRKVGGERDILEND